MAVEFSLVRVYGELPADAAGVEAPVVDPGTLPPRGFLRRWGWAFGLVVGLAAAGYLRLAADRGWPAPGWLALVFWFWWCAVAVAMFARYLDDQRTARVRADRGALTTDAVATVGTVTARSAGGTSDQAPEVAVVAFEAPDGPETVRWVLGPRGGDGPPLPRPGDPVAVWVARDRDAALLRYERTWAIDLLRQVNGGK